MKLFSFVLFTLYASIVGKSQQANNWDTTQTGFNCSAYGLFTDTINGYLYGGGNFQYAGGTYVGGIGQWNGTQWSALDSGLYVGNCAGFVRTITRFNNKIYAGGAFNNESSPSGIVVSNIACWDGIKWDSVGSGANSTIFQLKTYNGELYACGGFNIIGGVQASCVAKYDGTSWYAIHDTAWGGFFVDVAVYQGEVYICGQVGGHVYKFNGSGWQVVGGGILGISSALSLEVYNNELYVGGAFFKTQGNAGNCVQKWNGT